MDIPDPSRFDSAAGYLRLIHPVPVAFVMLGTAIFGLLAAGGTPAPGRFALMLLAMLGGQVALGAHNELCDREHDARHQPEKPIPAGLVRPETVPPIVAGGLLAALAAGWALGPWPLALLALGTGSGFVYNLWLKRTPLSGIPYLIALPLLPIWTWLVMDAFEPRLLWLYPLGGSYVLAIHLAQSLSDVEGDRASGARGLAVMLGRARTRRLIWAIALATALLMPPGALLLGERPIYGALAGAAVLVVLGGAALLGRRGALAIDRILMELLAACALLLAAGWILSVTG